MDEARALAIRLLSENRARIARGIRRLGSRLEPKFDSIPAEASEASIAGFLRDLEHFLKTNDAEPLASTVRATVRLRRHVGFTPSDFAVFSHAYLPVIRRVFIQAAEQPLPALRAFDDVENVVLPVLARLLADFALAGLIDPEAEGEDTQPSGYVPSTGKNVNPFAYLSVEEELTDPGRGPSGRG